MSAITIPASAVTKVGTVGENKDLWFVIASLTLYLIDELRCLSTQVCRIQDSTV